MKKKTLVTLLLTASLLTFAGCNDWNTDININSNEESGTKQVGLGQLKSINDSYLYYDVNTNIVYFWNGYIGFSTNSTTPTPYYAPNGLLYKYNPSTNTLEEIKLNEE